jgi:K+-transporting ATPase KdpF subunit
VNRDCIGLPKGDYVGHRVCRVGCAVFRRLYVLRAWLRKTLGTIMENLVLGIIAVALCAYLIAAMIRPEKF